MTWPATATKVHIDEGTDDPVQARVELAALVDKLNELRNHVTAYMRTVLDDADSATALATLKAAGVDLANTFAANQTVKSTAAGAAAGPSVTLDRDSAPAINNLAGQLGFRARDNLAALVTYAEIVPQLVAIASAAHEGRLLLRTAVAGVVATRGYLGQGMVLGAPASGDQGPGTLNLEGDAFKDGVPFLPGATQAQMEAATAADVGVTPAVAHHHPSAAKAWVRWNSSGTIASSYNVASVTDNGTGDQTVNLDTDFSTADYAVLCQCTNYPAGTFGNIMGQHRTFTPTVGACRFICQSTNALGRDPLRLWAAFYGDH